MIERFLSDHVGDRLAEAEEHLAGRWAAYRQREIEGQRAYDRLLAARASKSLWKRLRGIETPEEAAAFDGAVEARENLDRARSGIEEATIERDRWEAGKRGQEVVPQHLAGHSDRLIVYHGFRRRGNEIDHLLVGPLGLWAIEVKNERVVLDITGQDWRASKLDGTGKAVGREVAAADRGGQGRNWGRQVAEPAEMLADRLVARGHTAPIRTAVVLVRPGARVARCTDAGVDLVTTDLAELDRAMKMLGTTLQDAEVLAIAEIVESAHQP